MKQAGKIIYAIIYCRVSSEKQKTDGHGLDSQEARCREYAKNNGYVVDERMIFKDAASGGGEYTSRPGQVELVEFIDKHPLMNFVVAVDDISRVARDVQAHFQLRYALRARGVEIVSPNFNFENSPEGEMVEGVMAMVSQYHRKGNRRQVIQKMKARLEAGYWPFARKRGFDVKKDPIHGKLAVPNEQGLKILKPAMEDFAIGNLMGTIDFCKHLVEKKFWKGKLPEKYLTQAKAMLQDPFYAGIVVYEKWEVEPREGKHKPLISLSTHESILRRLKKPVSSSRIRKDVNSDFPLRGLLKCSACGKHLTAAWSKGRKSRYPYYFCLNSKDCPLYQKSLPRDLIQKKFINILKETCLRKEVDKIIEIVFEKTWKEEVGAQNKQESVIIQKSKELRNTIDELTAVARKTKNDQVREEYELQIEDAVRELKELRGKTLSEMDPLVPYRTALRKSKKFLKSPYVVWKKLEIEEQHKLYFFVFDEKLAFDPKNGYQTAETPTAIKLFEEFVVTNSQSVDPTGLEPATSSLQMRRSSQMS